MCLAATAPDQTQLSTRSSHQLSCQQACVIKVLSSDDAMAYALFFLQLLPGAPVVKQALQ
jgi:hypothetical protein